MGNPLDDPRAARLLASSPDEVGSLAGSFRRIASQAEQVAAAIRNAHADVHWTGAAADAFEGKLGKLPGDLDRIQKSYGLVGGALQSYESELGPIRSEYKSLAGQLQGLQSSLTTAQGNLTDAQGNLASATKAPGAKSSTPAVVDAHDAVNSANGAVNRLQGEVSGLEQRAYKLLDEFDKARGNAAAMVWIAKSEAPSQSWLSSALHAIGNFVSGVVVHIGESVWNVVSGKDLIAFIKDPSWHTFGKLVEDVAVTASLVAMVAAPFAAPELLEADGAALAGEDAVAGGAEGAAEGAAQATSTASKFGTAARNVNTWGGRVANAGTALGAGDEFAQGDWKGGLIDLGFAVAPNLGSMPHSIDDIKGAGDHFSDIVGAGDKQAELAAEPVAALRESTQAMNDYRLLRSLGINSEGAKSLVFSDGPPSALRDVNLDSPSAIKAAVGQANAAALKAANRAMHLGKPLASVADSFAVDPTKDKVKAYFHAGEPEPAAG